MALRGDVRFVNERAFPGSKLLIMPSYSPDMPSFLRFMTA
jgi:hypothetical protein